MTPRSDLRGSMDPPSAPEPPAAALVVSDAAPWLCRVEFWTEDEWAALPEGDRPAERAHAPGRGWFAAVPVAGLN